MINGFIEYLKKCADGLEQEVNEILHINESPERKEFNKYMREEKNRCAGFEGGFPTLEQAYWLEHGLEREYERIQDKKYFEGKDVRMDIEIAKEHEKYALYKIDKNTMEYNIYRIKKRYNKLNVSRFDDLMDDDDYDNYYDL